MSPSLVFVDGPYGMGKYPGDEIRTTAAYALYEDVFRSIYLSGAGHLVVCGTFDSLAWIYETKLVPASLRYRSDLVWHKPDWTAGAVSNIKTFSPRHELLLHFSRDDAPFYADAVRVPYGERAQRGVAKKTGRTHGWQPNLLGARRGDVWTIPGERLADKIGGKTRADLHPCQKPGELLKVLVLATTVEGDTVDEPFRGSDSLERVCQELNRQYRTVSDARLYSGLGLAS